MKQINNKIHNFGLDSLIYLIGNALVGLSGIICIMLYTRFFSPKDYGEYTLVISSINLINSLLTSWINQSIIRFTDYYIEKNKEKELYSTIILLVIFINLMFISLLFVFMLCFKNSFSTLSYKLYILSSILFVSQSLVDIFNSLLRAKRQVKSYNLNNFIIALLKVLIISILVKIFSIGIEGILISLFISNIIVLIPNLIRSKIAKFFSMKNFSKIISKEFIKYGVPLLGMSITSWVLSVSDRYIIKLYRTSKDVAIYSVSYNIASNLFTMIIMIMMLSAYPIIVKTWNENGKAETEKLLAQLLRYYFIITIPCLFFIFIANKNILQLLTTKDYYTGGFTVVVTSIGMIFLGITNYTNKAWELTKNTRFILVLNALAAITNIILNIIFIPKFGFNAAAVNTTISYGIFLILSIIKSQKIIKIYFDLILILRIIVSSFIMLLFLNFVVRCIRNNLIILIISVILGGIIYLISLLIMGELKNELNYIKNLFLNQN